MFAFAFLTCWSLLDPKGATSDPILQPSQKYHQPAIHISDLALPRDPKKANIGPTSPTINNLRVTFVIIGPFGHFGGARDNDLWQL